MELLPRTMGTRPRMAVEVRPEGVVAARAEAGAGVLAAVSRAELREGVLWPGLRAGNVVQRAEVAAAMRRALDGVATKGGDRSRYVTVVIPDAAVRVLLLDFDALPSKATESLAVVRFRLKKLLPFDAEHAVVSYQVMSSGRDGVRVLAVAMPCDVLSEYEGAVTEAGYQPGAVLPSTLAAVAGLDDGEDGDTAALLVNAGPGGVTTAIVRGGDLLLHRTVDLGSGSGGNDGGEGTRGLLPLVDRESSASEWARQDPEEWNRSERNRDEYDRMDALTEMQDGLLRSSFQDLARSSFAADGEEGQALPGSMRLPTEANEAVRVLNESESVSAGREVTQAVSVAAAYFEDTLGTPPPVVLATGTMGVDRLSAVLAMYGMDGLRVREMVDATAMGAGASTSTIPRGWMAGVRGALRS